MARPKTETERQQTGFRLRTDLVKALRHLAIDTGKPANVVIEQALEEYLQKYGYEVPLPPEKDTGK
jgi:hypothetical protein